MSSYGRYGWRLAEEILALVDDTIATATDPSAALHAILDGVESDLRRPDFRRCPFGNAASEYDDLDHPARRVARD